MTEKYVFGKGTITFECEGKEHSMRIESLSMNLNHPASQKDKVIRGKDVVTGETWSIILKSEEDEMVLDDTMPSDLFKLMMEGDWKGHES